MRVIGRICRRDERRNMSADDLKTTERLRVHMDLWRKGHGFNANPIAALEEEIRWLCHRVDWLSKRLDAVEGGRRGFRKMGESEP